MQNLVIVEFDQVCMIGKLATIQPLPPRPQAKVLASARPVTPTLNPLPQTPPFTPIAQVSSAGTLLSEKMSKTETPCYAEY